MARGYSGCAGSCRNCCANGACLPMSRSPRSCSMRWVLRCRSSFSSSSTRCWSTRASRRSTCWRPERSPRLTFDAIFNFLRRYLLLYATNKVDIRVATKTFGHLLGLPVTFFEHISAGVLVKHMQQAARIREFLTGRLFLTMLDALSLFVFVPVLALYSVKLTCVVLAFTAAQRTRGRVC